jgi:ribosomal protein S18 acetylase RimI-like enzyme
MPEALAARLPNHAVLGATLIGRLAVDHRHQRKGLGGVMIADAIKRSFTDLNPAASISLLVEAMNPAAVSFYEAYGFRRLSQVGNVLFLPIPDLAKHLR